MSMPGEIPSNIALDTLTKLLLIAPGVTRSVFTLVHWGYNPSYHLFLAIWVITSFLGLLNLIIFRGSQRLL